VAATGTAGAIGGAVGTGTGSNGRCLAGRA